MQAVSVGVLQAVGVVCMEAVVLSMLPGRPHTFKEKKKTGSTAQDPSIKANRSHNQNAFMDSCAASAGYFLTLKIFYFFLAVDQGSWNEKFPISTSS